MPQQISLPVHVEATATGDVLRITVVPDTRPAGPGETPDDETAPGSGA